MSLDLTPNNIARLVPPFLSFVKPEDSNPLFTVCKDWREGCMKNEAFLRHHVLSLYGKKVVPLNNNWFDTYRFLSKNSWQFFKNILERFEDSRPESIWAATVFEDYSSKVRPKWLPEIRQHPWEKIPLDKNFLRVASDGSTSFVYSQQCPKGEINAPSIQGCRVHHPFMYQKSPPKELAGTRSWPAIDIYIGQKRNCFLLPKEVNEFPQMAFYDPDVNIFVFVGYLGEVSVCPIEGRPYNSLKLRKEFAGDYHYHRLRANFKIVEGKTEYHYDPQKHFLTLKRIPNDDKLKNFEVVGIHLSDPPRLNYQLLSEKYDERFKNKYVKKAYEHDEHLNAVLFDKETTEIISFSKNLSELCLNNGFSKPRIYSSDLPNSLPQGTHNSLHGIYCPVRKWSIMVIQTRINNETKHHLWVFDKEEEDKEKMEVACIPIDEELVSPTRINSSDCVNEEIYWDASDKKMMQMFFDHLTTRLIVNYTSEDGLHQHVAVWNIHQKAFLGWLCQNEIRTIETPSHWESNDSVSKTHHVTMSHEGTPNATLRTVGMNQTFETRKSKLEISQFPQLSKSVPLFPLVATDKL